MQSVKSEGGREPLISVAMCTYNGARFLEQQLESILSQTYANLEIVIADDCSTDETVSIVKRYQHVDPRIRLIEGEKNIGFVKNFERVLSECSGELIALADQDDIWFSEKIDTLRQEVDDNLLVYSRVQMIDELGQPLNEVFPDTNRLDGRCALALLVGNCVTGHACLIRRELLELSMPFPDGVKAHDQWLAIMAAASGRMKSSDSILSYYRKHASNALLKNKKKRTVSRFSQNRTRDENLLMFIRVLILKGVLAHADAQALEAFAALMSRNRHVIYNFKLSNFLSRHAGSFLALYKDKDKARHKLCRGDWYFRLFPFA